MFRLFIYLSLSAVLAVSSAFGEPGPSGKSLSPEPLNPSKPAETVPQPPKPAPPVEPAKPEEERSPEKPPVVIKRKLPVPPNPVEPPSKPAPVPSLEPAPTTPSTDGDIDLDSLSAKTEALEEAWKELFKISDADNLAYSVTSSMERSGKIAADVLKYAYILPYALSQGVQNPNIRVQNLYQSRVLRRGIEHRFSSLSAYGRDLKKHNGNSVDQALQEAWHKYDYRFRNLYSFSQHFYIFGMKYQREARLTESSRSEIVTKLEVIRSLSIELFDFAKICSTQYGDLRKDELKERYGSWYEVHANHRATESTDYLPLGAYKVENQKIVYVKASDLVLPKQGQNSAVVQPAVRGQTIKGIFNSLVPEGERGTRSSQSPQPSQPRLGVDPSVN